MSKYSLFFYDLETSGFDPKSARIMQFGGQRTDLDLNLIGQPVNKLIKLTEDILPEPEAILITGISPQMTLDQGISEAEFLKLFHSQIATPGTIFVGFNNIRFDDEFLRYLHYRNFYDPYEWHWSESKSRWDLLDMVRMTRALRPEGLKWPFAPDGSASNRLELLAAVNKVTHSQVHDALSDVNASIAIARLIKNKQPKLFNFLLTLRDKQKVAQLVSSGQPFVYTSGKYQNEFEKTTVVGVVCDHPQKKGALVFDLRHDPNQFAKLTPPQLAEAWKYRPPEATQVSAAQGDGEQASEPYKQYGERAAEPATQRRATSNSGVPGSAGQQAIAVRSLPRLPVKTLQFNRCPAVAPLNVLDKKTQKHLDLDLKTIMSNYEKLKKMAGFPAKLLEALEIMNKDRQASLITDEQVVDGRMYDGFFVDYDKHLMSVVRAADVNELKNLKPDFKDDRLHSLLTLYKARNYPQSLSTEEKLTWQQYKNNKLAQSQKDYQKRLAEITKTWTLNSPQKELIKNLKLWAQAISA